MKRLNTETMQIEEFARVGTWADGRAAYQKVVYSVIDGSKMLDESVDYYQSRYYGKLAMFRI